MDLLTLNSAERRADARAALVTHAENYGLFTRTTAKYPTTLDGFQVPVAVVYVTLGLGNEVGELAELFDQEAMQEQFRAERYSKAWKELGDVQWYVARMCDEDQSLPTFAQLVFNARFRLDSAEYREARISGFDLQSALCFHAGVVSGVVKKMIRDGATWSREKRIEKREELASGLQGIVNASVEFAERTGPLVGCEGGYAALLDSNQGKLADRKERGVLHGDGGER